MAASHLFSYCFGLFLGLQIGKMVERTTNAYYPHTEKIMKLEHKVTGYEGMLDK